MVRPRKRGRLPRSPSSSRAVFALATIIIHAVAGRVGEHAHVKAVGEAIGIVAIARLVVPQLVGILSKGGRVPRLRDVGCLFGRDKED